MPAVLYHTVEQKTYGLYMHTTMYLIIDLFAESRLIGSPIEMQSSPPRGNECQQESTPGRLGERPITRGVRETFLLETSVTFEKLTLF